MGHTQIDINKMSRREYIKLLAKVGDLGKEDSTICGLRFAITCGSCPEQYDVFKDGMQVGYVHLRGGDLYASFPDSGRESEVIYSHHFDGEKNQWKGDFESDEERARYIVAIANSINERLEQEKGNDGEIYQLYLNKTRYCNALQCPKMLWLMDYKPELYDGSVSNEEKLDTNSEVVYIAKWLFDAHRNIRHGEPWEMANETYSALWHSSAICEASFLQENCFHRNFCSVDILRKTREDKPYLSGFELNEVKSSTSVKDVHLDELAFQEYVARNSNTDNTFGLNNIHRTNLVHINNQYVRQGELELDKLFSVEDVTEEVHKRYCEVEKNIKQLREYMKQEDEPEMEIGPQCSSPYPCGFWGHCAAHLPSPNIFDIRGRISGDRWDYYRQGIVTFQDARDAGILNDRQMMQVDHELNDLPDAIDKASIREFLKDFSYPLYFLDFETFQSAIPLFDDSRPYQQIPFMYSLHWIEKEGDDLHHTISLAYPGRDPRRRIAEDLCHDIPKGVCTLAYNMGFEKGRIRELADLYPDLADHLMDIHDNMKDLMIPFQQGWYYNRAMEGSYAIKHVLPALYPDDPELDYQNLEGVHNGEEASETYLSIWQNPDDRIPEKCRQLSEYCGLDTYALVKLLEKLRVAV